MFSAMLQNMNMLSLPHTQNVSAEVDALKGASWIECSYTTTLSLTMVISFPLWFFFEVGGFQLQF